MGAACRAILAAAGLAAAGACCAQVAPQLTTLSLNTPAVALGATVGAFPLSAGSADSAQIVSLSPGAYTVQVSGVGGTTGVALAEIYEVP